MKNISAKYKTIFIKLTLVSLIGIASFYAQQDKKAKLLICLGQEELAFHQAKSTGPAYKLNQRFISALAGAASVDLKKAYLKEVCVSGAFSPSVNLLKLLLLKGGDIFTSPRAKSSQIQIYQKNYVTSFLDQASHFFFDYLLSLQALSERAGCLEKKIPELTYFFERYKYLETDYSASKLIGDKAKIRSIFKKLQKLDSIIQSCAKPKKK